MLKMKNVVIIFIALLLILSIGTQVQATNLTLDLSNLSSSGTTDDNNDDEANTTTNETVLNVQTNEESQVVQPNTNTNRTGSTDNDLPQTGVTEDITVMFFIIVCAISAVYAYKKIRDYKA